VRSPPHKHPETAHYLPHRNAHHPPRPMLTAVRLFVAPGLATSIIGLSIERSSRRRRASHGPRSQPTGRAIPKP